MSSPSQGANSTIPAYNPSIGTFISPDTMVPDAGRVSAYNRTLYARGNPLKFVDPSGHCAALDDGSPDLDNDAGCWDAAAEWRATFGAHDNEQLWLEYFSSKYNTEDALRSQLYAYWYSLYVQLNVHPLRSIPCCEYDWMDNGLGWRAFDWSNGRRLWGLL